MMTRVESVTTTSTTTNIAVMNPGVHNREMVRHSIATVLSAAPANVPGLMGRGKRRGATTLGLSGAAMARAAAARGAAVSGLLGW